MRRHRVEKENPSLKGVLSKDYNRPSLDEHRLGELIDLIGTIGLGDAENRSKDVLGRVYEVVVRIRGDPKRREAIAHGIVAVALSRNYRERGRVLVHPALTPPMSVP